MPRFALIYIYSVALPVIVCFGLFFSNTVCIDYQGFAADSEGNLYVGKFGEIEKLNPAGEKIGSINPMTSRGYDFTLTNDREIQISLGDRFYRKDLSDNLIEERIISPAEGDPVKINRSRFTAPDGTRYVVKRPFFRTCVYRYDGETLVRVYTMPLLDYCVRLFWWWYLIGFACVAVATMITIQNAINRDKALVALGYDPENPPRWVK